MACANCTRAQTVKHWPIFQADCHGCKVRAIASGPALHGAIKSNTITSRYRDELRANFGEGWKDAHEEVKAERQRLDGLP